LSERLLLTAFNGSRLDVIADKHFVRALDSFEKALLFGEVFVSVLCQDIIKHPRLAKAFEFMLEREEDEKRGALIEHVLLEYELIIAMDIIGDYEETL
jgi:hypothetical protein